MSELIENRSKFSGAKLVDIYDETTERIVVKVLV